MTEALSTAYKLAHFSSLLEVSVGINLVFSFWDTLRCLAVSKMQQISEDMSEKLSANLGDKYKDSRCQTQFDSKKNNQLKILETISSFAKWLGIISTIGIISLLIKVGLDPEFLITETQMYTMIFFAVVISPLFLLVGNLYVYYAKHVVESYGDQRITSLQDVKEFAE
jgi:ABC-type protease/lipase transport system fused ATPase/permease subunit